MDESECEFELKTVTQESKALQSEASETFVNLVCVCVHSLSVGLKSYTFV